MSGLGLAAAVGGSLGERSPPSPLAQRSALTQPAYAVAATDPWDSYKLRLAALARQQGVRESTIQRTCPGSP